MNAVRLGMVARQELRQNLYRPMMWLLVGLLVFLGLAFAFLYAKMSGASAGGQTRWITSEFAVAYTLALVMACCTFFVAIVAGLTIIRDEEHQVGQVLHGTPLTPQEYVWGKFAGVIASFLAVLVMYAIVTNVVAPPSTSMRTELPRSFSLNRRSSMVPSLSNRRR